MILQIIKSLPILLSILQTILALYKEHKRAEFLKDLDEALKDAKDKKDPAKLQSLIESL